MLPCLLLLQASHTRGLAPLPRGIGLYSKLKSVDVQGEIRALALEALRRKRREAATESGATKEAVPQQLLEFEFPPLLGGAQSKTQLDDFTNVDVLDRNRDNAMFFAAAAAAELEGEPNSDVWVVFMDDTEKRLAAEAFPGARFRRARLLTQAEAVKLIGRGDAADPLRRAPRGQPY